MKKIFIDTNLIVYTNDSRDKKKQRKAIHLVGELMKSGNGVISTQVLQEYTNVALNKLNQDQSVALRQLVLLEGFEVVSISPALIRRGIEIKAAYNNSFWDSIIISTAEYAKCDTVLSEDFNPSQFYSGIVIENPF